MYFSFFGEETIFIPAGFVHGINEPSFVCTVNWFLMSSFLRMRTVSVSTLSVSRYCTENHTDYNGASKLFKFFLFSEM